MAGPLMDPPAGTALGVFTTREAAEEFIQGDPFVLNRRRGELEDPPVGRGAVAIARPLGWSWNRRAAPAASGAVHKLNRGKEYTAMRTAWILAALTLSSAAFADDFTQQLRNREQQAEQSLDKDAQQQYQRERSTLQQDANKSYRNERDQLSHRATDAYTRERGVAEKRAKLEEQNAEGSLRTRANSLTQRQGRHLKSRRVRSRSTGTRSAP